MSVTPNNLLRAEFADMQAYHVPDTTGLIKLDAMENPYAFPGALPEGLQQQWLETLKHVELNRYPSPQATELKKTFQQAFSLSPKLELMFGNGSDELIQLLIMAVAKPNASILTVTPSFSMYKLIAEYVGVRVVEVPLQQDSFALQMDLLIEQVAKHNPAVIFLACPNNPTGTLWPKEQVEEIIKQSTGLVVIDEAYSPFAAYSLMPLVEQYPHALMMRTLSKMGLAGLRLGWMLGDGQWMNELNKMRLPYNINALTQASASFALQNIDVFNQQAGKICQQREVLMDALQKIKGVEAFSSEANFILFRVLGKTADIVHQRLLEQKIIIKNVSSNTLLENCLRVTVGSEKENQAFIKALGISLA
jgi:histidinol-phosphate aminotransferase